MGAVLSDDHIHRATREALTDLKARIDAELGRRRQHGDAKTVKDLLDLARAIGWTPAQGDVVDWLRRRAHMMR